MAGRREEELPVIKEPVERWIGLALFLGLGAAAFAMGWFADAIGAAI